MLGKLFSTPISLDKEMKLHGFANTIGAFGLGFPSHIALSNTAFIFVSGGVGRVATATLCICMACIVNYIISILLYWTYITNYWLFSETIISWCIYIYVN